MILTAILTILKKKCGDSAIKPFNDWIAVLPFKALTVNPSTDQN